MGMVIKARNFLNTNGMIIVHFSFIYPYLSCGNHIWRCIYKTNLQWLVILRNRLVRIISRAKARDSSQPYRQLDAIKLTDQNNYLIVRFMFGMR